MFEKVLVTCENNYSFEKWKWTSLSEMVPSACLVICFGCFSLCNSGLYFVQLSHCHCKTNYVKKNITQDSILNKGIFISKNREREDQWAQKDSQVCQEIR